MTNDDSLVNKPTQDFGPAAVGPGNSERQIGAFAQGIHGDDEGSGLPGRDQ